MTSLSSVVSHCVIVGLLLASLHEACHCLVSVNPLFSDGLVLQTNLKAGFRSFIYGTAAVNETVKITGTLSGCPYTQQADSSGDWIIEVDPVHTFGTSYEITISGDTNASHAISIRNISFGDVFLCLGSDNMAFPMHAINNSAYELEHSNNYPTISFASIPTINAQTPQRSINSSYGPVAWVQANASTLSSFSSLCYISAQKLYDTYQQLDASETAHMSVGLVQVTVPGSMLSCWMSQTALSDASSLCQDDAKIGVTPKKLKSISNNSVCSDSSLFNGMLSPLLSQTYRAVLFSGGENEVSADGWGCKLRLAFNNMRDLYASGDFAVTVFGPGSADTNATTAGVDLGDLRQEELTVLPGYNQSIYVTAVVSNYDLGNRTSATSKYKKEIAVRAGLKLARIGPVMLYDHNMSLYEGPVASNAFFANETDMSSIWVNFTNLDGGTLRLEGTTDCDECCGSKDVFEVSTDNNTWYGVDNYQVYGMDESMLLLANPVKTDAASELYVRYARASYVQCAVYREGSTIPAFAPFTLSVAASAAAAHAKQYMKVKLVEEKIDVSDRTKSSIVAATPPMGFNSWNFAHCNMDARLVRRTAQRMIDLGLRDVGYKYLNLDDCWQTDRTRSTSVEEQVIIPDSARYPEDMSEISSWLGARGFKFGIYTARKQYTCQDRFGSYLHEEIDVITYCNWNISYIKVDACHGDDYSNMNESWARFRRAIDHNCSHDIVLSVESCGSVTGCGTWVANYANLWRTSGDIQDTWSSMISNADGTEKLWSLAGPGHWNDPDMLIIGNAGLSNDEERVQLSLWSIMASPLLIATDLMSIANDSLQVLLNSEVIAVNQDVLGVQGRKLVANTSGTEIWYRPLDGGDLSVVLLNRDDTHVYDISVDLTKVGVGNGTNVTYVQVRELWQHQDMGNITYPWVYTAKGVKPHACSMIRVVPYFD